MVCMRLIIEDEQDKAWNMAVDQALLELSAVPILRVYSWKVESNGLPAMSIGYLNRWQDVPADRAFVRRMTGGGVVDHAYDFTYSIVLPLSWIQAVSFAVDQSYAFFHRLLAEGLEAVGVQTRLAIGSDNGSGGGACFLNPVPGDLLEVKTNRKVAGAAQRRNRLGLLHQGSVLGKSWSRSEKEGLGCRLAALLSWEWGLALEESTLEREEMDRAEYWKSCRYALDSWNRRI